MLLGIRNFLFKRMLNWNSQRVLNNSSSLQPERHVPLTFKTKQTLLLKRQHSAHTKKTACSCRRADKIVIFATAHRSAKTQQTVKEEKFKTGQFPKLCRQLGGGGDAPELCRAAPLPRASVPTSRQGLRHRVPWFSGIIRSRAGGLMGLLAVICNPAKNRRQQRGWDAARGRQGADPQLPNPGIN